MKYRVYIVEDDMGISKAIKDNLEKWGMEVSIADDFQNVLLSFSSFDPQLVLMDIGLPYMDGYHWCKKIREISSVPIIFISSAADNMNIVMAMNMGGDDFIAKPFDQSVLLAKIQAVLRRTYDFSPSPILKARGLSLNTGDCCAYFDGQKIELSKNEYKILLTLMQNKGKVVSREKLMEALWETESFVDENTLTVNVGRLRKKIESLGLNDLIQTKFGVGYILGE